MGQHMVTHIQTGCQLILVIQAAAADTALDISDLRSKEDFQERDADHLVDQEAGDDDG